MGPRYCRKYTSLFKTTETKNPVYNQKKSYRSCFYRAMHSADYAVERCLSVRRWHHIGVHGPSHHARLSKKKRLYIYRQTFSPSDSHNILVFLYNKRYNGGVECKGVWKMAIFDRYLDIYRKWYKREPWKANRKPIPKVSNGSRFSDLERSLT